jgi:hypothetical protein
MATTTKVIPLINSGETVALTSQIVAQVQSDWNAVSGVSAIANKPTIPAGSSSGTPAVTLGTTNAMGNSGTFINSNATIAVFDTIAPTTQAFGDVAVVGTATVAARRDHKHAMPTVFDTTVATTLTQGAGAGVAGSSTIASRVDHRHAITVVDNTTPSTQAFGDSAYIGTSTLASRADHKHAMPVNPANDPLTISREIGYQNNSTNYYLVCTLAVTNLAYTGGTVSFHVYGGGMASYEIMFGVGLNGTPNAWDSTVCYVNIVCPFGIKDGDNFALVVNYATRTAKLYYRHTSNAHNLRYISDIRGFYNSGTLDLTRDITGIGSLPVSDFSVPVNVYTT